MKHCQRKVPPFAGVMKLNVITWCGPLVHGEVPHRLLFSFSVVGEAMGTLRPRPGMANVCWTLHPEYELSSDTGLPFTYSTSPIVPVTWPQIGLRSGVQPSYPSIVTFTLVAAGTSKYVVGTHWGGGGLMMK